MNNPDSQPSPEIPPHQARVYEERDQLADRLSKLRAFLASTPVPITQDQRMDLVEQKHAMQLYLNTLDRRIAKF